MNPLILSKLFLHHSGWKYVAHSHLSVMKLYLLYVVPLSLIPPLMVYFAGTMYVDQIFPVLSANKLQMIVAVFFLVELAIVPIMGWVIQALGEVAGIKPHYREAFTLAAVAPTPLWLAPLFLFVPNLLLNITVTSVAMIGSAAVIYYAVPALFHLKDKGRSLLVSGSILAAGLVAWVFLMVLTLLTWSYL